MSGTIVHLWLRFAHIGLFSIGGGYAVIPLIRQEVVEKAGWLSQREFTDIIAISQMTPGPLAVNTSTFVGMRLAGLPGAMAATFGCVLSGLIVSLFLYRFFSGRRGGKYAERVLQCLKATSVGLIAAAGGMLLALALTGTGTFDIVACCVFAGAFYCLRRWDVNPILLLAGCGLVGLAAY